jgi:hypothetical protein
MTVINDLNQLNNIEEKRVLIKGTFTRICSITNILEEKVPTGSWAEAARHILKSNGTCKLDKIIIDYAPEAEEA